jgi:excinuclease ABC subunit C
MDLPQQLKILPAGPGVYLFRSDRRQVLYVGKAKNLRPRVRSYFRPATRPIQTGLRPAAGLDPAKQKMIHRIARIETIMTDTETEALILEAQLIRRHQPPYNVILRDDKFYLFIKITTNEEQPRVFPVRRLKKDGARYFGPYSSAASVRQTLGLLRRIFPYRGEKESPREKIFPHPLFGHGGEKNYSLQTENYKLNIDNIIHFLQGHRQNTTDILRAGMKKAAANKQFERAAIFRDQLQAIERLEGNQKVFLPRQESLDTISLAHARHGGNLSCANIFQIRGGKLLGRQAFLLRHRNVTAAPDILRQFLLQYYSVAQDIPPTILVPAELGDAVSLAKWINHEQPPLIALPKRGKKRQLLAMGELNARQVLDQEASAAVSDQRTEAALAELAKALGIKPANTANAALPRIETYDISNIQGTLATGSMVVFTNGVPDKQHYKKFRLKWDQGPNDYAMLQEVLRRRFSPLHHDWTTPDLVLIDGGRGQLNAASQVLAEQRLNVPVAALAKREEILFVHAAASAKAAPRRRQKNKMSEIRLPYDSPALFLLQRMRDESHRFTLAYHRLLRSKRQRHSLLDEIPGIGPQTKKKLLRRFGSLKGIRAASNKDLARLIGQTRTATLRDYL